MQLTKKKKLPPLMRNCSTTMAQVPICQHRIQIVSPSVVVLAGEGVCGNQAPEIWDTRLWQQKPMVVAE
ncbi:hypothetical protein JHK82_016501 [Glycine max]|nr:hypothetical protein JHK82_016501 [Glycine max]